MSEESLKIDFQAGGIADVQKAFASIEAMVVRLEKQAVASEQRTAKARIKAADTVFTAQTAALKKDHEDRLRREDAFGASMKSAAQKHAVDRLRVITEARRQEVADAEKAEREKTRIFEQEEAKRTKAALARRKELQSTIGGIASGSARGTVGAIAGWGGMALGLAGGVSVGTAARRAMGAEVGSVALANSMFNPMDKEQQEWLKKNGKKRFDDKSIRELSRTTQAATGVDKEELMKGWQDYIAKSSDWGAVATKEGQGTLTELAKLSKASGADFSQVMSAAGSLRVQNANLTPEKMMDMMRAIVGQGKMGAVEMKDLAAHASTITASAGSYAGDQTKNQAKLLGLAQIAVRTSASPAEAATAVARFSSDVMSKKDKGMKAMGIDPDMPGGGMKAPSQILADMFAKTGGDMSKFGEGKGKIGLGAESIRVAQALNPTYRAAYETAKAGGMKETDARAVGVKAVKTEVEKFENAGYDKKDIDEDFRRVMATTTERFNKVMTDLTEKVEVRVVPFLEKLAVALEKNAPEVDRFIDGIARMAEYLVENPFKGVAALIMASVAKDLAAAGIQKAAEKALSSSLGSMGIIAASAAIAIEMGTIAINEMAKEDAAKDTKSFSDSTTAFAEAKALERDALEGKMTKEKAARLEQIRSSMAKQVDTEQQGLHERSTFQTIFGGGFAKLAGADPEAEQKNRDAKLAQSKQALDELDKATKMAAASLKAFGDAAKKTDPNAPHRNGPMSTPARGGTGH